MTKFSFKQPDFVSFDTPELEDEASKVESQESLNFLDDLGESKPEETKPKEVESPLDSFESDLKPLEEKQTKQPLYVSLLNRMIEDEVITSKPEDFDTEKDAEEEDFLKVVKHNIEVAEQRGAEYLVENLDPLLQRAIQYNLNRGDMTNYFQVLAEEQTIKNLDPENEPDQEKIVREWLKFTGTSTENIDKKINRFKESGILKDEAAEMKVELDKKAEEIAKGKEKVQQELAERERNMNRAYKDKVFNLLKTEKLGDVKVSKEDSAFIYSFLTGEETELDLGNGLKKKMPMLEALIFKHKYSKDGLLNRLALIPLLLEKPDVFDKLYKLPMETKVTKEFLTNHKYGSWSKGSSIEEKKETKETGGKYKFANLKLK